MIYEKVQPFADQIGPYLPLIGVVAGALIVGAFAAYNRRKGAVEGRLPTIKEMWDRLDEQGSKIDAQGLQLRMVTRDRDAATSAFNALRNVFLQYVHRSKGPDLTDEEMSALEIPAQAQDDEAWPTAPKKH